jgi:peptidoglycan/xylan/chitin deacetylase (PgdA/CDA1 family)
MKRAALNLMRAIGVFDVFRLSRFDKTLVVMYHRFGSSDGAIAAQSFEQQLDYLKARYNVVPLSFVAERLAGKQSLPPNLAVITIDDGYRDAYEVAMPLLKKRNLAATLFVATGFVDGKTWLWTDKTRYLLSQAKSPTLEASLNNRKLRLEINGRASRARAASLINAEMKRMSDAAKEKAIDRLAASFGVELPARPPAEFAPLSWGQVKEMEAAGVEIGSHTVTHPILTNVDGRRLSDELNGSRDTLESILDRKVNLFCYPNGDFNSEIKREVRRAGYTCAVTTDYGFNDDRSDALALSRIPSGDDLAQFAQGTSGFEQFKLKLRRRDAALNSSSRAGV